MQITFDTNELTDLDKQILSVLAGGAPAPKTTTTAKTTTTTTAAKKAEPEPEPEADDSDDGATMKDAVAVATKLVSNGEAAKVKAALAEVGAKRVSELKDDDIATFVASLS